MKIPEDIHFEVGPIRPPSEARSLLVRVHRNCPWNRCTFCPVYKKRSFSPRSVDEVLADIEAMARGVDYLREISREGGYPRHLVSSFSQEIMMLAGWLQAGGKTVFLQDANALLMKPKGVAKILRRLRQLFPHVERVTTYARSHTLVRRSVEDLCQLREAGLDRVHVGMESGCDEVLAAIEKGCTKREQIEGGRRVMEAGLELSEYLMPGLGGKPLWQEHARESADAISAIEPDFVRLRSLGLRRNTPLAQSASKGQFEPLDDEGVVREIRLFLDSLGDCGTTLVSDHFLNLLQELEGTLPDDKPRLMELLDGFVELPPRERHLFMVGRRMGIMLSLDDRKDPWARTKAESVLDEALAAGISPGELTRQIVARFV